MGYKLFLDDMRQPSGAYSYTQNPIYLELNWVLAKDYNDFVNCIKLKGMPDLISFDHDLADIHYGFPVPSLCEYDTMTEMTGYHCAKWLIEYCMDNNVNPPEYLVHSMNVEGGKNIKYLIENYKRFLKSQK
jgi:hypothetical protein